MLGILVGLLNAASHASLNVFLKKLSDVHPHTLTVLRTAGALPILALAVTLFSNWGIPPLPFWLLAALAVTPIEVALAYTGTKALQLSPMSIIAPLSAFTSVFLIPVGFIVLGELPSALGLLGVLAIFIGSLLLGFEPETAFFTGIRQKIKERGILLAFLAAFLASVTISITKVTFQYAPPLVAAFYINLLITLALIPLIRRHGGAELRGHKTLAAGLIASQGIGAVLHPLGLALLPAVYFISVKRLGLLMNVIAGKFLFEETHLRERLAGAALMVGGVVLIALG